MHLKNWESRAFRGRSRLRIAMQYEYGPGLECKTSYPIFTKRFWNLEKWVIDELYPEYARNIKKRCCWHCWMTSFWKFCWTTHVAGLWASHHLESEVGTDASKPSVQRAARNRQLPKMNWTMNLFRRTWCHVKGTWKRLMEIWQKLQKKQFKHSPVKVSQYYLPARHLQRTYTLLAPHPT